MMPDNLLLRSPHFNLTAPVPLDGMLSLPHLYHPIADVQENTLVQMCTICCRSTVRRNNRPPTKFRFRSQV
jgi:hypothetical protein